MKVQTDEFVNMIFMFMRQHGWPISSIIEFEENEQIQLNVCSQIINMMSVSYW